MSWEANPWPPPDPGAARHDPLLRSYAPPSVGHPGAGAGRLLRAARIAIPVVLVLVVLALNVERAPADPYPSHWDDRVSDLVAFVERTRELEFDHPVEIEFLATDAFDDTLGGFDPAYENDDTSTALYHVLGLADDYDPGAATETGASLVLGYFDGVGIKVRGDQLTPAVRTVLVHELTHALQAQHFEVSAFNGANSLALIEGDAMRIEDRYVATLDADDRAAVEAELYFGDDTDDTDDTGGTGGTGGTDTADALPWTLGELQVEPYVVGPSFLAVVEADGGTAAVDDAIRTPPADEGLVDPWQYLDPRPVGFLPELEIDAPAGADVVVPSRPFGLFEALVLFDTWLPWQQTRRALDGWRDGAIVVHDSDDRTCATVALRVDTDAAADRLATTVDDWADAAGTDAEPTIDRIDGKPVVSFTSCDRSGPAVPTMPVMTPSWSIVFENQFVTDLLDTRPDLSRRVTRCAARRLVDDAAFVDYVTDPSESDATWDAYVEARDHLLARCQDEPHAQSDL